MQYIITRMESTESRDISWRITAAGNAYHTKVWLKNKDLKDMLRQIAEQDIDVFKGVKFSIMNRKI